MTAYKTWMSLLQSDGWVLSEPHIKLLSSRAFQSHGFAEIVVVQSDARCATKPATRKISHTPRGSVDNFYDAQLCWRRRQTQRQRLTTSNAHHNSCARSLAAPYARGRASGGFAGSAAPSPRAVLGNRTSRSARGEGALHPGSRLLAPPLPQF